MSEAVLIAEYIRSLPAQSGPLSLSLFLTCSLSHVEHCAHSASAGISPLRSAYDLTGAVCLTLFANQHKCTLPQSSMDLELDSIRDRKLSHLLSAVGLFLYLNIYYSLLSTVPYF